MIQVLDRDINSGKKKVGNGMNVQFSPVCGSIAPTVYGASHLPANTESLPPDALLGMGTRRYLS